MFHLKILEMKQLNSIEVKNKLFLERQRSYIWNASNDNLLKDH